jgi:HAD superfamily hydrolase (TIGR01549 family)
MQTLFHGHQALRQITILQPQANPLMHKLKGIIFDLDGTLANTLPLCITAFRKSIEPLANRTVSNEEIIATFGPSEEGTIRALVPDHYDTGVKQYLAFYEQLHHTCPDPFGGIPELLTTLKSQGIRIAMVTGKGPISTELSLKQFKLQDFFELIETGSPAGPHKADGIQAVLNHWSDLEKEEVIYVGDAPSDIEASRKAGIAIIAAAWATTAEPEKLIPLQPDQLFYQISDFSHWLTNRI